MVFLQAGDDASTAPAYGWRSLAPGLNVERVPGKHMDILESPNVEVLASLLRVHLAKAIANVTRRGRTGQPSPATPQPVSPTCS